MTLRVEVEPNLLNWAIERSGLDRPYLAGRFKWLGSWLKKSTDSALNPTLKQIEAFAKVTYTPVGYFFLDEPPEEKMPIPDYRTMANAQISRPSVNLLDTVYICQQRQDWYRDYARDNGIEPLDYVGSVDVETSVKSVAADIRKTLNFALDARASMPTWEEALRSFIDSAEAAGIMVMLNGVVSNNTRRKLNPEEFRGFALTDDLAPLVFVNGADTKSAQMFTLAHELAHIWLGKTALSSADIGGQEKQSVERWCNKVAAELLVPLAVFKSEIRRDEELPNALQHLARHFKVSTLVILRRMLDAGHLSREEYGQAYDTEIGRLKRLSKSGGQGGDFYRTQFNRLGKRFAQALIASTMEGQTLYRDAMSMVGVKKVSTFNEIGRRLGLVE